jgi:A/G-specific adenine glycosylase
MASDFAAALLRWHAQHGRHDLPWQKPRSAYRVWVSEIMLQQTRVETVLAYFQRFMRRFPDVAALAQAPLDDVLVHWSGLGYYARARNLHRAAQQIHDQYADEFPRDVAALEALPGIGRARLPISSASGRLPKRICPRRTVRSTPKPSWILVPPYAHRAIRNVLSVPWRHPAKPGSKV